MISKKIIGASLGLAILLGGTGFMGYEHFSTQEKIAAEKSQNIDPLTKLLQKDLRKDNSESGLKADFTTQNIFEYDGPISEKLQKCLDTPLKPNGKDVIAPYNPEGKINQQVK